MVFARIDRNPGRVVLLCKTLWAMLQQQIFLHCPRYVPSLLALSSDVPTYAKDTINDLQEYISDASGISIPIRAHLEPVDQGAIGQ